MAIGIIRHGEWKIYRPNQRVYKSGRKSRYYVRLDNVVTGERKWIHTGHETLEGAQQAAVDWINNAKKRKKRGRTFQSAYEQFLRSLWPSGNPADDTNASIARSTYLVYKADGELYAAAFGDLPLVDIDMGIIEQFLTRPPDREFKHAPSQKRRWSARNRRKHLSMLKGFFEWAIGRGFVRQNPCARMKPPKGPVVRKRQTLTPEEARCLLQACQGSYTTQARTKGRKAWDVEVVPPPYLHDAVLLALLTGLRRENLLGEPGLRFRHLATIDNIRVIRIPRAELPKTTHATPGSHPDYLVIPLHANLIRLLDGCTGDADEHVLGTTARRLDRPFKRALRRAELPESFSWHHLRHTFSQWINDAGVSYPCHVSLMDHSRARHITLNYIEPGVPQLKEAIDRLPTLLEESA